MHDDRRLTEARLDRVLRERVWPAVYTTSIPLEVARWDAPGEPVTAAEGISAPHEPARVGDAWGPAWGTTWFRLRGRVPAEWAGRTVEAVVDLGFDAAMPGFQCEGLVHLADGTVVKGLNPRNAWIPVGSPAAGEETVEFHVEAAANPVNAARNTRRLRTTAGAGLVRTRISRSSVTSAGGRHDRHAENPRHNRSAHRGFATPNPPRTEGRSIQQC